MPKKLKLNGYERAILVCIGLSLFVLGLFICLILFGIFLIYVEFRDKIWSKIFGSGHSSSLPQEHS